MDEKTIMALTSAVVGALGVGLRALARWVAERTAARDIAERELRERAQEVTEDLINVLRERITALEMEVKALREESCNRGCRLRLTLPAP